MTTTEVTDGILPDFNNDGRESTHISSDQLDSESIIGDAREWSAKRHIRSSTQSEPEDLGSALGMMGSNSEEEEVECFKCCPSYQLQDNEVSLITGYANKGHTRNRSEIDANPHNNTIFSVSGSVECKECRAHAIESGSVGGEGSEENERESSESTSDYEDELVGSDDSDPISSSEADLGECIDTEDEFEEAISEVTTTSSEGEFTPEEFANPQATTRTSILSYSQLSTQSPENTEDSIQNATGLQVIKTALYVLLPMVARRLGTIFTSSIFRSSILRLIFRHN